MNKSLVWISSLSSALQAGLDTIVSNNLQATTHNICILKQRQGKRAARLSGPNRPPSPNVGSDPDRRVA
jgi:hypothetical protein